MQARGSFFPNTQKALTNILEEHGPFLYNTMVMNQNAAQGEKKKESEAKYNVWNALPFQLITTLYYNSHIHRGIDNPENPDVTCKFRLAQRKINVFLLTFITSIPFFKRTLPLTKVVTKLYKRQKHRGYNDSLGLTKKLFICIALCFPLYWNAMPFVFWWERDEGHNYIMNMGS